MMVMMISRFEFEFDIWEYMCRSRSSTTCACEHFSLNFQSVEMMMMSMIIIRLCWVVYVYSCVTCGKSIYMQESLLDAASGSGSCTYIDCTRICTVCAHEPVLCHAPLLDAASISDFCLYIDCTRTRTLCAHEPVLCHATLLDAASISGSCSFGRSACVLVYDIWEINIHAGAAAACGRNDPIRRFAVLKLDKDHDDQDLW